MTTSHSEQNFMHQGIGAIMSYLHLDLAVAGVALMLLLAGGLANDRQFIRAMESVIPNLTDPAGPQTPAEGMPQRGQRLLPAMDAALEFVAQRYRVAPVALQPVFEAAQTAARERNLDPLLIIAVISIESGFNPFAQSSMGAQGLMQIIPRYHQDKLPKFVDADAFLDPVMNVRIGTQILQEAVRRQGNLMAGLQYYAGAGDDIEQGYANKVIAEKLRLEQATRRKNAPGT